MTVNTMRFQANAALAFGTDHLWWGCWALAGGPRTSSIRRARSILSSTSASRPVNADLKTIGQYVKFRRVGTELVGFKGTSLDDGKIRQSFVGAANSAVFTDVKAEDDAVLAVGHFLAKDGSGSTRCSLPPVTILKTSITRRMFLALPCRSVARSRFGGGTGEKSVRANGDGRSKVDIRSNEAVFVIAQ